MSPPPPWLGTLSWPQSFCSREMFYYSSQTPGRCRAVCIDERDVFFISLSMTTLRTGASVGLATSSLSTLSPNYFNSTSYIWLWQGNCPSIAIRELRHSTLGEKFTLMFSNGRSTMADIWPKNVPNIEILSCSFHTSNIWLTGCSEVWQAIYCLLTVTSHVITDNTTPENYTFKTILFFYIPDLNMVSLIVKGNRIKKIHHDCCSLSQSVQLIYWIDGLDLNIPFKLFFHILNFTENYYKINEA